MGIRQCNRIQWNICSSCFHSLVCSCCLCLVQLSAKSTLRWTAQWSTWKTIRVPAIRLKMTAEKCQRKKVVVALLVKVDNVAIWAETGLKTGEKSLRWRRRCAYFICYRKLWIRTLRIHLCTFVLSFSTHLVYNLQQNLQKLYHF